MFHRSPSNTSVPVRAITKGSLPGTGLAKRTKDPVVCKSSEPESATKFVSIVLPWWPVSGVNVPLALDPAKPKNSSLKPPRKCLIEVFVTPDVTIFGLYLELSVMPGVSITNRAVLASPKSVGVIFSAA